MKNANEPIYPDPMRGAGQSFTNQSPYELPTGLSKREYFAVLAMQAIIPNWNLMKREERDAVADIAVEMADSLLRKLKNTK